MSKETKASLARKEPLVTTATRAQKARKVSRARKGRGAKTESLVLRVTQDRTVILAKKAKTEMMVRTASTLTSSKVASQLG